MTRLTQMRGDVIVLLDEHGNPHVEVRPHYTAGTGPGISFYRIGGKNSGNAPEHMFTLRSNTVNALVRKLPIVTTAARRLLNESRKPAK